MTVKKGKLSLSASSIKVYEQCQRKYFYTYIEKPDGIIKQDYGHLRVGNFVHAVLENFHNRLQENPALDIKSVMSLVCKEEVSKYNLQSEEKVSSFDMLKGYMSKIDNGKLPNVISSEQRFSIPLSDDVHIKGFIDRIDRVDSDNLEYHIIDYKGLALDTPIPTADGWTTMEKLKVGDFIFGSNGKLTKVTVKSNIHNRPCYKIIFTDKSEVTCDNVHLWPIGYRKGAWGKNYEKIFNTEELYHEFWRMKQTKINGTFVVQNPKPFDLPEANLPIDPWILGVWLGDGRRRAGSITIGEEDFQEMSKLVRKHWGNFSTTQEKVREGRNKIYNITLAKPYKHKCSYRHKEGYSLKYKSGVCCKGCVNMNNKLKFDKSKKDLKVNYSLTNLLAKYNLQLNKHIPAIYLRASIEQRLELLRGLMDTDGHWNKCRKACVFVSANINLAEQFLELVRSLGVFANIHKVTDKKEFVSYQIWFSPTEFNPFKLPRKANAFEKDSKTFTKTTNSTRKVIKDIIKVDSVPTQCISVDASDSLYVCGKGMTLTHNTGQSKYLDEFQLLVYGIYLLHKDQNLERFKGSYIMLAEDSRHYMPSIFTKTDIQKTIDKILNIASDIRNDKTWKCNPTFLCNYCDFKEICPESMVKVASNSRKDW